LPLLLNEFCISLRVHLLFGIQLRKVIFILFAIRNYFRYMLCLATSSSTIHAVPSYKQQHNMNRCELHIMPAPPNPWYYTFILPSIITTWRTLEISNLERDILSFPFIKMQLSILDTLTGYKIIKNYWVQKFLWDVKWYFVVLTWLPGT
jgi:hypothetical protein